MKKLRVLLAKPKMDTHDNGLRLVSQACRDAGMEVIYLGTPQSVEQMVEAAVQEDIDILGISILTGDHMVEVPKLLRLLQRRRPDVPLVLGGIVSPEDVQELMKLGVAEFLGPGTAMETIMQSMEKLGKMSKG